MERKPSRIHDYVSILKESMSGFMKDDCLSRSAALAYYSAFSLAPLLLIAVAMTGIFFGEKAVHGALDGELRQSMGPAAATMIQDMIAHARKPANNILISISGLALLLLGAAAIFGHLQATLNAIWNVAAPPARGIGSFIHDRILSFSMVLVTGFLMLISMLLTTALQAFGDSLGRATGLPVGAWLAGSGVLSFAAATVLFSAIFKILPDTPIRWRDVWIGGAFTAAFFMIGKLAMGWYLGREAAASSYGSAGSFVVMLTWLYYSSMILLFGAEFTRSHAARRGVAPEK